MKRLLMLSGAAAAVGGVAWLYLRRRQDGASDVREGALYGGLPYLEFGSGPALVVFPGLTPENANPTGLARRMQLRQFQPLGRDFTVFVIQRKPGLPPGSSIKDMARHYAEAIERKFAEPVDIVGLSTGGTVAQQFAIDYPRLVRRLMVLASAHRLSTFGREAQRSLARFTTAGKPRRAWAAIGPALAGSSAGGRMTAGMMWLLGARMAPHDPADMLVTIDAEDVYDASPELYRITAPTLILGGDKDNFYGAELFRETAAAIPHAQLRLYPGKGHAAVIKPAVEDVGRILTDDAAWAQSVG